MRNKLSTAYSLLRSAAAYAIRKDTNRASLTCTTLDGDDISLVKKNLQTKSDWTDEKINIEYEHLFASQNGNRYAFSFISGRVALYACLEALELKKGDIVLIPGYTCIVVVNALLFKGLIPVFCDIELDTYGLDIVDLKKKYSENLDAKAIILQHLYGLVCRDYEEVLSFANNHSLWVIEDCSQATGAKYKGIKVGNRGNAAFFSSEQSKLFCTFSGGMAVTNSSHIGSKLSAFQENLPYPDTKLIEAMLRNLLIGYYSNKHPLRMVLGPLVQKFFRKYRLPPLSQEELLSVCPPDHLLRLPVPLSKVGINQLKKLPEYNEQRRKNARRWDEWCVTYGYKQPFVREDSHPVFLRYPVLVDEEMKKDLKWAEGLNVIVGVWFVTQLHPVQQKVEGCPNAEIAVKRCINFPTLFY
jgi:perosamine synthetase